MQFNLLAIVLLLFFSTNCVAGSYQQVAVVPDGSFKIFLKCEEGKRMECLIYARNQKGSVVNIGRDFPVPGIDWINNKTAELSFSCGNPCDGALFYNAEYGKSYLYPSVVAVDSDRLLVAYISKNAIAIRKIFRRKEGLSLKVACKIVREWSPVVLALGDGYVIRNAEFRNDGVFHLAYVTGSDYKLVQEDIKIDTDGRCLAKQQ